MPSQRRVTAPPQKPEPVSTAASPRKLPHVTVVGGGLGGLAVGYYANKKGMPFTLHEARDRVGGNAITLQWNDCHFDSGAHRLHDRDTEVTEEFKRLLGRELRRIHVPSQIYDAGAFVGFPLTPLSLMSALGMVQFAKAVMEVLSSRLSREPEGEDFEHFALRTYGPIIARRFLLNYTEKLWGIPCSKLSSLVAGKRMKGLGLKTFLIETLYGNRAKMKHVDGPFFYPERGIGMIAEALGRCCGAGNIRLRSRITQVFHNHAQIEALEIDGKERVAVDRVVSTLPLTDLLRMMTPKPPEKVLGLGRSLRYRDLILVALFLNKASCTTAATVYFPDSGVPFTRVYEPRNRSPWMSPRGKTSLVAEIPCQRGDRLWGLGDDEIAGTVRSALIALGWMRQEDILGHAVVRMDHAYPVLEVGIEKKVDAIFDYLKRFPNLRVSGRSGRFAYVWIHDMMRFAQDIVNEYARAPEHGPETP